MRSGKNKTTQKMQNSRKRRGYTSNLRKDISPLKLTKGLWSSAEFSERSFRREQDQLLRNDRIEIIDQVSNSRSTFKSIPEALREQRAPMSLLLSDNITASRRALSRLLAVVMALSARTHKFVRACPTVLKREQLMFRSLARIRNQLLFRSFVALINNVFDKRRERRLALEANKRCMRIFRALQMKCFNAWRERASREAKGKRFLRQRLGGIKLRLYTKWKTLWAEQIRAKECETLAKAFIQRYKMRGALKCLHALQSTYLFGVLKVIR